MSASMKRNIELVSQCKNLGSMSSAGLAPQSEMTARLSKAGSVFHRLTRLWGNRHILRQVKVSVYKAIAQAILLYGSEAWAAP